MYPRKNSIREQKKKLWYGAIRIELGIISYAVYYGKQSGTRIVTEYANLL